MLLAVPTTATFKVYVRGMPLFKTITTHYNAKLGLPDKGRAINELVVCNNWDLERLKLLNGLALGCFQPPHEVSIVYFRRF